jgi:anaerobic ribonucleoside-triphosphate reductase
VFVINRNEVWVETTLMKRQAEDTVEENEMEKRVYRFLQDARERIVGFVNRNIVWDRMIREDYKDTKVIQKFKEEVIEQVKAQFKKIMGKK